MRASERARSVRILSVSLSQLLCTRARARFRHGHEDGTASGKGPRQLREREKKEPVGADDRVGGHDRPEHVLLLSAFRTPPPSSSLIIANVYEQKKGLLCSSRCVAMGKTDPHSGGIEEGEGLKLNAFDMLGSSSHAYDA